MSGSANPFLEGNFAPVSAELDSRELTVEGTVPASLRGQYCRIGPNPIDPDPEAYHWFMGDGMVHSVGLGGGQAVSYQNRWVRTDRICKALGDAPIPQQPGDVSPGQNRANTNIIRHAGRFFALEEASLPVELSPELATVGRFNYGGELKSNWSAHPKIDPSSGELHTFAYGFQPPFLTYYRVNQEGRLVQRQEIEIPRSVMIHDFALTERHAVFFDLPVVFDLEMAMAMRFPFSWKPECGARVGLMSLSTGEVRWHEVAPCYVYHPLNAYEDDGVVIVDVVRHASMFARKDNKGPDGNGPAILARWTVPQGDGPVVEETLCERGAEFPRMDERRLGRCHRYGYRCTESAILKHDVMAGTTESFEFGEGAGPSEAVFVPESPDADEDEGWLLSIVHRPGEDASDFVVLDASSLESGPVARIELPQRVPFGFHGNWFAE